MPMNDLEFKQFLQIGTGGENLVKNSKINPKTCTAREYVETFIFPTLLPALYHLFTAAKENLVFEVGGQIGLCVERFWQYFCQHLTDKVYTLKKRRTKFNACDFLTEHLYNNNPNSMERSKLDLCEIPFVKEILSRKPRLPIPLSLIWSDEEAALVMQSHWRGYLVRRGPEVQELRQYQKEMKESSYHIMFKVEEFWKKHQIEDGDDEEIETEGEEMKVVEEDTLQTPQ